jgi:hypothetical protein
MPQYQTRHLEALKPIPHGDRSLAAGDKFTASDVDADYYIQHGKAKDVAKASAASAASAPPPPPPPPPPPAVATAPTPPTAAPQRRAPAPSPAAAHPRTPTAPAGVTTLADVDPARAEIAKPGASKTD